MARSDGVETKLTAILLDSLDDKADEAIALLNEAELCRVGDALRKALVGTREAEAIASDDPDEPPLPFNPPPSLPDPTVANGLTDSAPAAPRKRRCGLLWASSLAQIGGG